LAATQGIGSPRRPTISGGRKAVRGRPPCSMKSCLPGFPPACTLLAASLSPGPPGPGGWAGARSMGPPGPNGFFLPGAGASAIRRVFHSGREKLGAPVAKGACQGAGKRFLPHQGGPQGPPGPVGRGAPNRVRRLGGQAGKAKGAKRLPTFLDWGGPRPYPEGRGASAFPLGRIGRPAPATAQPFLGRGMGAKIGPPENCFGDGSFLFFSQSQGGEKPRSQGTSAGPGFLSLPRTRKNRRGAFRGAEWGKEKNRATPRARVSIQSRSEDLTKGNFPTLFWLGGQTDLASPLIPRHGWVEPSGGGRRKFNGARPFFAPAERLFSKGGKSPPGPGGAGPKLCGGVEVPPTRWRAKASDQWRGPVGTKPILKKIWNAEIVAGQGVMTLWALEAGHDGT